MHSPESNRRGGMLPQQGGRDVRDQHQDPSSSPTRPVYDGSRPSTTPTGIGGRPPGLTEREQWVIGTAQRVMGGGERLSDPQSEEGTPDFRRLNLAQLPSPSSSDTILWDPVTSVDQHEWRMHELMEHYRFFGDVLRSEDQEAKRPLADASYALNETYNETGESTGLWDPTTPRDLNLKLTSDTGGLSTNDIPQKVKASYEEIKALGEKIHKVYEDMEALDEERAKADTQKAIERRELAGAASTLDATHKEMCEEIRKEILVSDDQEAYENYFAAYQERRAKNHEEILACQTFIRGKLEVGRYPNIDEIQNAFDKTVAEYKQKYDAFDKTDDEKSEASKQMEIKTKEVLDDKSGIYDYDRKEEELIRITTERASVIKTYVFGIEKSIEKSKQEFTAIR